MTDTEYLPALPAGWCWTTLETSVDILDNQRIPINSTDREERKGNIPYYGATGQVGWINDYLFDEELVLLGEDGAPFLDFNKNKAYIVKGKSWVNNHAHVLRAVDRVLINKFLCHYLNTFDYHQHVTGTTRLKLNQSSMRKIPIILPPLSEQHRIVQRIEELFTDLDAGIQELEKAKMQIKNYRQVVLKLALQGKLVHQNPADESALKLIETIRADLIRDKIDGKKLISIDSEKNLFDLPDPWKWIRLGEVLIFGPKNGYSPKPVKHVTNVRALTLTATTSGKFRDDCFKYIDEQIDANSYLWLKENDLLIQRGNTIEYVGVAAVYKGASNAFIYPDLMMKMRVHPKINVDFLHMVINSKFSRKYFEKRATGTAGSMPKINQSTIVNLPIPLPPLAEQKRIVYEIERRFSVIDQIEKTIDQSLIQAEKLRQSILKKAFEGKLVPQNPNDEPANSILKIMEEKVELKTSIATKRKRTSKLRTKNMKTMKDSEKDAQNMELYEILNSSKKPLNPKELWQLSKLDIEDFYEKLKIEVEKGRIIEYRPNNKEVYLGTNE